MTLLLLLLISCVLCSTFAFQNSKGAVAPFTVEKRRFLGWKAVERSLMRMNAIQRDALGYEIKPRDWFNGLSLDPGASLTDPRAVPPVCKEFAEQIKANKKQVTLDETIKLIDEHYNYFEVPFKCGDVFNAANENTGSAKIFSFALMTKMNEEQTLRLFGEVYRNLKPDGNDHPNLRTFIKRGWAAVTFESGLAIVSKLQAFDDTESALATQSTIEGGATWDINSDSWIP